MAKRKAWLRECKVCGESNRATKPNPHEPLTEEYRQQVCKHCKNEGQLGYGQYAKS